MKYLKKFNLINEDITRTNLVTILDSVPITNNQNINGWLCDNMMHAYRNNEKNLMKTLTDELTTAFGRQNLTKNLEFRTKIWILEYKDLIFNVFTANIKGTSIEICNFTYDQIRNGERERDIIDFLQELYYIINN